MGAFSIWHILLVGVVAVLVFGAGRIPLVMGEVGKGVKAFKKGMNDITGGKDVDRDGRP